MSKGIHLEGADDRDDGKFEKASDSGGQLNYLVGDEATGKHCHMYDNHETGQSGVVHRNECAVCDDAKDPSSKTGGESWPPSESSDSGNSGGK